MGERETSPFDEVSENYLDSAIFSEGADLDQIENWLGEAECVLDVGTGTLHTAGRLQQAGVPHVVGLDPSRAMLREGMSQYPSVQPVGGSAESLPVKSAGFDSLVCRYAAHHFETPRDFFWEARRCLTTDGVVVFQDLVIEAADELGDRVNEIAELRDPSHERYRSPEQWTAMMEDAGLEILDVEGFTLPLSYRDWVDRSDPSANSRAQIKTLFGEIPPDQRRRINLTMDGDRPESFEYPVTIIRGRPRP